MPLKVCLEPRCPSFAVYRGRCALHSRQRDKTIHRAGRALYKSKRWQILRRRVLFEQPLCDCGELATDVDHIVAIEDGGAQWSRDNLKAMCGSCHSAKTRREQMARAA